MRRGSSNMGGDAGERERGGQQKEIGGRQSRSKALRGSGGVCDRGCKTKGRDDKVIQRGRARRVPKNGVNTDWPHIKALQVQVAGGGTQRKTCQISYWVEELIYLGEKAPRLNWVGKWGSGEHCTIKVRSGSGVWSVACCVREASRGQETDRRGSGG